MNLKQPKIIQAFEFAHKYHAGTTRKGSQIPYIAHPMDVAAILLKNHATEDLIVAGLLHDVIEEENVELGELERQFGEKVAQLVDFATEPAELRKGDRKKSWKTRKQHTLDNLEAATQEEKLLSCADKLSNIRDTINDFEELGDKLWGRFNATFEQQRWYYRSLCEDYLKGEGIGHYPAYKQLKKCVERLYQ
ncbi:MAG: HD domain-containing protein [Candidatus Thorarchaeota archaeon]